MQLVPQPKTTLPPPKIIDIEAPLVVPAFPSPALFRQQIYSPLIGQHSRKAVFLSALAGLASIWITATIVITMGAAILLIASLIIGLLLARTVMHKIERHDTSRDAMLTDAPTQWLTTQGEHLRHILFEVVRISARLGNTTLWSFEISEADLVDLRDKLDDLAIHGDVRCRLDITFKAETQLNSDRSMLDEPQLHTHRLYASQIRLTPSNRHDLVAITFDTAYTEYIRTPELTAYLDREAVFRDKVAAVATAPAYSRRRLQRELEKEYLELVNHPQPARLAHYQLSERATIAILDGPVLA